MELTPITQQERRYRLQFISELDLPISVTNDEVFYSGLKVLDEDCTFHNKIHITALWNLFKDEFINAEECSAEARKLNNLILNDIVNTKEYKALDSLDIQPLTQRTKAVKDTLKLNKNLYTEKNLNKKFISLDIKEADYSILKVYNVVKEDSFTNLIKKYTDKRFFEFSKKFRQSTLGKLNGKRSTKIQEYLMTKMLSYADISSDNITLNSDEIIVEVQDFNDDDIDELKAQADRIEIEYGIRIRTELFSLEELRDKNTKLHYIKRLINDEKTLKTVPKTFIIQALKTVYEMEIVDADLYFYSQDKELAKYIEPRF